MEYLSRFLGIFGRYSNHFKNINEAFSKRVPESSPDVFEPTPKRVPDKDKLSSEEGTSSDGESSRSVSPAENFKNYQFTQEQMMGKAEIALTERDSMREDPATLWHAYGPLGWSVERNVEAMNLLERAGNKFVVKYSKEEFLQLLENPNKRKVLLLEVSILHNRGYVFKYNKEKKEYSVENSNKIPAKLIPVEGGTKKLLVLPRGSDRETVRKAIKQYQEFWDPKKPDLKEILGL